ncbi:hypothetical protein D3C75_1224940 [compost metagenome]
MMGLLPAILFLLGLVMLGWDLTEEKHKKIIEELNNRRDELNKTDSNQGNPIFEDHSEFNNFTS